MFTKGQWIFALLFVVAFVAAMVYTYRKDLALHKKYYRGSIWILIAFIAFIFMIAVIKWLFV